MASNLLPFDFSLMISGVAVGRQVSQAVLMDDTLIGTEHGEHNGALRISVSCVQCIPIPQGTAFKLRGF